jgi:hypothetical protein
MRVSCAFFLLVACVGCGGDDGGAAADAGPPDVTVNELDISVCDLGAGPFSLTIDNPYFPLVVANTFTLRGQEGVETVEVIVTVLDETEVVGGVVTRVVEERESTGGELVEVSRNYFAQAPDGTVCYFGEAVDIYDMGTVVSHDGAWRADEGENRPGIIMPATPHVGDAYRQEVAPGIAQDHATITAMGETITVPAGTFTEPVRVVEDTPLEPGNLSVKVYAAGQGMIVDDVLERQ